jgi:N-acyl-D-aspartate/D-glutamate deacylase
MRVSRPDAIPFHYLANAPHTEHRVPAQHATLSELKTLLSIVRRHDRVWQCTPDVSNRARTFLRFFLTSGRLFGRPLRTSALTAIDLAHERNTWKVFPLLTRVLNSKALAGRIHFQVLATPFRMYAEGAICPIFEEFESTRRLMACDIAEADERRRIMTSDEFGETFVREWHDDAPCRRSIATSTRCTSSAARWPSGAASRLATCTGGCSRSRPATCQPRAAPANAWRSIRSLRRSSAKERCCCT